MSSKELDNLCNKEELYAAATAWVHVQWTTLNHCLISSQVEANVLPQDNPSQKHKVSPSNGAVLGKDVMEAVQADMALTELPSWITKAPLNWGTVAQGKLSANNWRVICTIHLPITLIRLWRGDDLPDNQKAMLENFMDLVHAVQITNLCSISQKEMSCMNTTSSIT